MNWPFSGARTPPCRRQNTEYARADLCVASFRIYWTLPASSDWERRGQSMKKERSEKANVNIDRRQVIEKAGLFLGATGALVAARPAAAQDNQGNGFPAT